MSPPTAASATRAAGDRPVRGQLERGARGGDGPVADAPVQLLVGAAGARRDARRGSRPASPPGRPRSRTGPRWNSPMPITRSPRRAPDDELRVHRRAHGGQVLGRIGLAERAADRAAVADHGVGDHALGVGEDREQLVQERRFEEIAMTGHRPDPDLAVVRAHIPQLPRQRIDVYHVLRGGEPELHHREQAVPTGQQPGVRTELLQQRESVFDARRALITKRCWDLQDSSLRGLLRMAACRCYGRRCQTDLSDRL